MASDSCDTFHRPMSKSLSSSAPFSNFEESNHSQAATNTNINMEPPRYHRPNIIGLAVATGDVGGENDRPGDVGFTDGLPAGGQIGETTHRQRPRSSTSYLTLVPKRAYSSSSFGSVTTPMSTATHGSNIWSPNPSSCSSWPSSVESHAGQLDLEAPRGKYVPDPENNPFTISTEALAKLIKDRDLDQLQTYGGIGGIENGLLADCSIGLDSNSDDSLRRSIFGTNQLPKKKSKSIPGYAVAAVKDPTTGILLSVQLLSLAMGILGLMSWRDIVPSTLILAVVLSVDISLSYRTDQRYAAFLSKQNEDRTAWVIRSGCPTSVSVCEVMVGDLLKLKQGDRAPADGILITGRNMMCDESCNTGESRHIAKSGASEALRFQNSPSNTRRRDPFIISGSRIVAGGSGTCLVTCVGINSTQGCLMLTMPENTEETPLQQRLGAIAKMIGTAAILVAILLSVTRLIEAIIRLPAIATSSSLPSGWSAGLWRKIMENLLLASTVIFVAVPEGLPMAVLTTLYLASIGMKKDGNVVRELSSCETMGNATTVCCDKTGTLTTNEMHVTAGMIGTAGRFSDAAHFGQVCSEVGDILLKSAAINSSVFVGDKDGKPEYIGSSTETALVRLAEQCFGLKSLQEERNHTTIVEAFPFDSTRKCMATVTKVSENLYRMYVKGAPETLLEKSDRTIEDPSQPTGIPMTEETRHLFIDAIAEYASTSLRTLGLAYRDFPARPSPNSEPGEIPDTEQLFREAFQNLTFLGVLGIQDPIRPGVKDAVEVCQGAGVVVRMVTGDNVNTAKAVATECGILDQAGLVLEGPDFRQLSDDERKKIVPRLRVLARSSPEDKKLIVLTLKELGETVAVTGDGTNDGPALRAADVGFAMGISGTDVAKEASSIVLEDDSFASIVKAIAWGRAVIDGIRRFLQFQLTVNMTVVTLTVVSAVSTVSQRPVLTNTQLFWVNMIMDSGAALALATDGPGADVLNRRPEKRSAPLLSLTSWKMIVGQASYQLFVGFSMHFYGRELLNYPPEDPDSTMGDNFATMFFNMFIWMQLFNLINSRRVDNKLNVLEGALKNKMFVAVTLVISICQVLFIFFGGEHLQLQRLDASEWALSVGLGFMSIPLGMAIRCIPDEPLQRVGKRVATKTRLAMKPMVRLTPNLLTAIARVRNGLTPQWLRQAGLQIVSIAQAMEIRDTESMPDERTALLAWQDMV